MFELSDEMTFVDLTVQKLLGHAGYSQVLELYCTDLLLHGWISNIDIFLDAFHHRIETSEVVGVPGQFWVHVVAHLHDGISVGGFTNLTTNNSKVEGCGHWGTSMLGVHLTHALLHVLDVRLHIEGVRDFCHL